MKMSDSYMLNQLAALAAPGLKWVCRDSVCGRGLRLHQTTMDRETDGSPAFDTPREALAAFIESKEADSVPPAETEATE